MLGIGLNVATGEDEFPEELRGLATSLAAAGGHEPARDDVLSALLAALDERLAEPPARIVEDWSRRDALRGRTIRWQGGEGTATGIDESGALIVRTSSGRVTLDAGEVHLLR